MLGDATNGLAYGHRLGPVVDDVQADFADPVHRLVVLARWTEMLWHRHRAHVQSSRRGTVICDREQAVLPKYAPPDLRPRKNVLWLCVGRALAMHSESLRKADGEAKERPRGTGVEIVSHDVADARQCLETLEIGLR